MSKSNGTDSSVFQTELKDAKIESSKLPPLYAKNNNKPTEINTTDTNEESSSNINLNSNNSSKINNQNSNSTNNINSSDNTDIISNNDSFNSQVDNNNNGNDVNNINNSNSSVSYLNTDNDGNNTNPNNDADNNSNNQNGDISQEDADNKEEIRIGDDEGDSILQEQASTLIGAITGESNQSDDDTSKNVSNQNDENMSKNSSNQTSDNESESKPKSNSRQQSNTTSQKNSAKSSTANSTHNSVPISNRSSSSITSHSYSASRNASKTVLPQRRIGKLPSSKISYNQEMSKIPKDILHNPYVTKRLNIFPPRKTNPPKAALSHVEYRNRTAPQTDELTEKILNGEKLEEEPTVDQLKNSANILRNIEKDLIDKSQYPEAKKAADALQKTLRLIKKKSSSNEVKTDLEDLISKRNELIILADSRKEDWDDAISKYQSDTEAHVRDMKQHHQEKIEKFNSEIPSELTPLFKRNSVCYLTMRSNEKYLALNRHFDEAQKIKVKADQIEEIEREENFSKMDEYYRRKRDKMKQLQDLEIFNYLSYADTRKNELIFQKEKSIAPPLQRAERIDREIKRICEKRGIKQNQLNFDLVDNERVKLIKSKEKENEEMFKRTENSNKTEKKKKSDNPKKEKNKDNENVDKLEEEENNDNIKNEEEENIDDDNNIKNEEEENDINNDDKNEEEEINNDDIINDDDENDKKNEEVQKNEEEEIEIQNDEKSEAQNDKVAQEEEEENA